MTEQLEITLLGSVQITLGGTPLAFVYTKAQALLCYLAVTARPHARDALATLFWGEMPDREAKNNLRNALSSLLRLIPGHMAITRETAALDLASPYTLDVKRFLELSEGVRRRALSTEQDVWAVHTACDLYRGEFLDGFFVREAPAFEEWVLAERESLRLLAIDGLDALIAHHAGRGEGAPGIEYCRKLLAIEPLQEQAHRQLMLLLALDGQREAALMQYETCRRILLQDLGIEPMPETTALYQRIAEGDLGEIAEGEAGVPLAEDRPGQLIGRSTEFARIEQAWDKALKGTPQMVVISGEAGIGKTHLAEEIVLWAHERGIATATARVREFEGKLLYAPVTHWLRSDAIRKTLALVDDVWLTEIARLIPEISTKRPNLSRPTPISDAGQRTRFFEAIARAIFLSKKPLLLWLDDLQWCDSETLAWLQYLLHYDPQARLLLLTTLRVEETVGNPLIAELRFTLQRSGQLAEIELGPLNQTAAAALAAHVAGRPLSPDQTERLFRETEGNPLFLTEMVRAGLIDQAHDMARTPNLPPTMLAVIGRRLAQLSTRAHELAGVAAVIDHVFDLPLLARISDQAQGTMLDSLEELTQRRILREVGEAAYDLSHAKIREVAYSEQSSARRRELHRRVASALEAIHANALDAVSARIAVHYERAGMAEQAVPYYTRAGNAARQVYANEQAIAYFRKGLELLAKCPPAPDRDCQELTLQKTLGMTLGTNRGWASADAMRAFTRAHELALPGGQPADLLPILTGLTLGNLNTGRILAGIEMAGQLLELGKRANVMGAVFGAHWALGITHIFKGDFATCLSYGEQGVALYDPLAHGKLALVYGQDGGVNCRMVGALAAWFLGYPDRALEMTSAAVKLARELGNPYALAGALLFASWLDQLRGDVPAATKHLDELIPFATERRFPIWLGLGLWLKGWALAMQGECQKGIETAQQGLALHDEIGEGLARPVGLVLLAETYRMAGQLEEADRQLVLSLQNAEQTAQCGYVSEANRLRGEILLRQAPRANRKTEDAAEKYFSNAMAVARDQQARSFELRAATSLGTLWKKQGKPRQAHDLLAKVVGQFQEGFDTADLKQARALLARG